MEPLAAVALAGNILQFVETTRKIITSTRQLSLLGATEEQQELSTITHEFQALVSRVAPPQLPEGAQPSREEKSLCALGRQCERIAQGLLRALDSLKMKEKDGTFGRFETFHKSLLGIWKQSEIDALLERLDRIQSSLHVHLTTYDSRKILSRIDQLVAQNQRLQAHRTSELHELRLQFRTALDGIGERLDSKELRDQTTTILVSAAANGSRYAAEQAILEHLRFNQIDERHNNIRSAHEHTFNWLFGTGEQRSPATFDEWLTSDDNVYWISGKPGSGKSTLIKFLCNHQHTLDKLSTWSKNEPLVLAKYFLWNAGMSLQKSQEGLLRSIVYQILRQCPELIPQAYPNTWHAYFPEGTTPRLADNPATNPRDLISLSVHDILNTLRTISAAASNSKKRFCIFIDGLDEYHGHPQDVIDLIRLLRTLPKLKLCLSSRPWNEFEQEFGKLGTRKLYMEEFNSQDISAYVHNTLAEDRNYQEMEDKDTYGNDLVDDIVKAANGVFLWVFLVVRSFQEGLMNGDRVLDLKNRLIELPTDLNGYFERILLSDVTGRYHGQSAQFFLVTLEGLEDIPVMAYWFISEYDEDNPQYALEREVRPFTVQQVVSRVKTMKKRLNACCKGLLELRNTDTHDDQSTLSPSILFTWKVGFLHRTVRDFLMLEDTRHLLQHWCASQFEPHEALCKALLAMIKVTRQDHHHSSPIAVQELYAAFRSHSKQLTAKGHKSTVKALHKELSMVMKLRGPDFIDKHRQIYDPDLEPFVDDAGESTEPNPKVSAIGETGHQKDRVRSWRSKLRDVWK